MTLPVMLSLPFPTGEPLVIDMTKTLLVEPPPMKISIKAPGYVTGWCASGGHEGAPVLSTGGALVPVCRGEYEFPRLEKPMVICGCWCHEMFRQMRDMQSVSPGDASDAATANVSAATGDVIPSGYRVHVARPVLDEADAVKERLAAPLSPVVMPLYEKLYRNQHLTKHLADMLQKHCGVPYINVERIGLSGVRAERGSLDVNVEVVCRMFRDKLLPLPSLTPSIIAMFIDPYDAPSHGAVHACLRRFMNEGFIERCEPVSFKGFIGGAIERPIRDLRAEIKRAGERVNLGVRK